MAVAPSHEKDLQALVSSVPGWARVGIALVGTAVLLIGARAVFATENGTGSAALIAAGLALVFLAVLVERLESLEAAGLKLQLRKAEVEAAADSRERAADAAAQAGDDDEAKRLRAEAQELRGKAQIVGAAYEGLRSRMPAGWERTAHLDRLLREAAQQVPAVDAAALRELFRAGGDGDRVFALRLMQNHPLQADPEAIVDAILRSRSAMEQWHAIKAAEAFTASNPDEDGVETIKAALRTGIRVGLISDKDLDRYTVAHRVLGISPGTPLDQGT